LERRNILTEVGGPSYVTTLVNLVPTSVHVEHYGRIIERTATMRRLIAAAGQIATLGYEDSEDTEATLDRAEQILFAISQRRLAGDFLPLRTLLHDYLDCIDYVHQHRGQVAGVPTGFADLDRLTGGLQPSDLIIIGARPSMGKTAMAVSMAHGSAMKHGTVVGMFALEMSAEQIVQRFMSIEAAVDQQRLRTGYIDDQEWDRIIAAAGALSEAPIYIDDTPGITTMEVRAKARRLAAQVPLGLINHRLPATHAGPRARRWQPSAGDLRNLPVPEGPGAGTGRAGDRPRPVVPRRRVPPGPPPDAVGPKRERLN